MKSSNRFTENVALRTTPLKVNPLCNKDNEIAVPRLWATRKCFFAGYFFLMYEFISAK